MSTNFPHEPFATPTVLLNWPFNTLVGDGLTSFSADGSIISDPTATAQGTASPANVAQARWLVGAPSGGVQIDFNLSPTRSALFIGTWFRYDYPGSSNGQNKLLYIKNNSNTVLEFVGPSGSAQKRMLFFFQGLFSSTGGGNNCQIPQAQQAVTDGYADPGLCQALPGNITDLSLSFQSGLWHRLEIYMKKSRTGFSADGIVQTWMDGVRVHDYANVNCGPDDFYNVEWTQTWDGQQDASHPTNWYVFMDHLYISTGVASTPDTVGPAAPTGVMVS